MADPSNILRQLLQGQRGSPDLPSRAAQQAIQTTPTDQALQDYVSRFGLDALDPNRMNPNRVPMPRPRLPYLQPGAMGMEEQAVPPGVTLRPQDVQAMQGMQQGANPDQAEVESGRAYDDQQNAAFERQQRGLPATTDQPEGPSDQSTTDEQMLDQVHRGMGAGKPPPGSDMKWQDPDEDRAALEANPSPENVEAFKEYWGVDQLPPDISQGGK